VLCGGNVYCCDDGMSYHGADAHVECVIGQYDSSDLQ